LHRRGVALFKHLLDFKRAALAKLRDKRKAPRYAVAPGFPVTATITLPDVDLRGRRSTDAGKPAPGRDWGGALANIAVGGMSIQLPPAAAASRGDKTMVVLSLEGYQFRLPATVAHFRVQASSAFCGLSLDPLEPAGHKDFVQLLEVITVGSTFVPIERPAAGVARAGFKAEQYKAGRKAVLTAWRDATAGKVDSFELQVDGHCLRGVAKRPTLEIFSANGDRSRPAWTAPDLGLSTGTINVEVRKLYRLVTLNLPRAVRLDVRELMQFFANSRGDWSAPPSRTRSPVLKV
jgi:hypothetical protein